MHWDDLVRHPFAALAHLTQILLCTIVAAVGIAFVGLGVLADIAEQGGGFALLSILLSLSLISLAIGWATFQNLKAVVRL